MYGIVMILTFVMGASSEDSLFVPMTVNVDAQLSVRKTEGDTSNTYTYSLSGGQIETIALPMGNETAIATEKMDLSQSALVRRVHTSLQIQIPFAGTGITATLHSIKGRELASFSFDKSSSLPIPENLSTGIYILSVATPKETVLSQKISFSGEIGSISIVNHEKEVRSTSSSRVYKRETVGESYTFTMKPNDSTYRDSSFDVVLHSGMNASITCTLEKIFRKKGVCKTTKTEGWEAIVQKLNSSWHYSWGWELKDEEPEGVEFVPMIWGRSSKLDERIAYLKDLKREGKVPYLLGFNEPDGAKQSDMTVDEAIALWPKLESVGVPLGSPAVVNAENEWLAEFMEKADQKGLRVDFITVHYYGGTSVTGFLNKLKRIYDRYQKPLWITEFAVADWSASTVAANRYTPEQVLTYMQALLPKLEEAPYIERYSWFSFDMDRPEGWPSALYDPEGNLTPLGEYYAQFKSGSF